MRVIAALALALICLSRQAQATTVYSIAIVCKFDIEQYCKSIPKVRIRELRECLGKHQKNLFPNCQDHYKEAK
jgi:hypothetical protein